MKQLKPVQNMPTTTMSREKRLLLEILLKECERIFPPDPSKAGLHFPSPNTHTYTIETIKGRGGGMTSTLLKPTIRVDVGPVSPEYVSSFMKKSEELNKVGLC